MRRKIIILFLILIITLTLNFFLNKKAKIDICSNFDCSLTNIEIEDNNLLQIKDKRIMSYDSEEIKLRGVNLGGWLMWEGWIWGAGFDSQSKIMRKLNNLVGEEELTSFKKEIYKNFITENDIKKISEMGFNVVRLPIHHSFLEGESNWLILDDFINWCEKYNVYVVLTMHSAPGGQAPLFTSDPDKILLWESVENVRQTVSIWKAISDRYKDKRIVAGYDLINEPVSSNEQVLDLYKALITVIRKNKDSHILILEGGNFAKDLSLFENFALKNTIYSFHMYTWFGDDREKLMSNYMQISNKNNIPLWVGEYGENTYEMFETTVKMFEENKLAGWVFWTWKKAPNKYPHLLGIETSEEWKSIANYIKSPFDFNKPSKEQVLKGMKEFEESVKFENNIIDAKMQNMLQSH